MMCMKTVPKQLMMAKLSVSRPSSPELVRIGSLGYQLNLLSLLGVVLHCVFLTKIGQLQTIINILKVVSKCKFHWCTTNLMDTAFQVSPGVPKGAL